MNILIDSSVWIDYFRSGKSSLKLDEYIEQNIICTNDLILAELIPFLRIKNQYKIIKLLNEVTRIPLHINWKKVMNYQTICIKNGLNKVGIPDLIILDNTIQNNLLLYSLDKHFRIINKYISFRLLEV